MGSTCHSQAYGKWAQSNIVYSTLVTFVGVVRGTSYQSYVNQQQGRMVVSPVSLLRMQRQRARVIVASSPISGIEGDKFKRIYTWQSGSLLDSGCHRTLKPWSLLVASHVDPLLACSDPILLDLISKGIYRSRDH